MLGLVFSTLSQDIGLWKRRRNDLLCVESDVKQQLSQSVNLRYRDIALRSLSWSRVEAPQDSMLLASGLDLVKWS